MNFTESHNNSFQKGKEAMLNRCLEIINITLENDISDKKQNPDMYNKGCVGAMKHLLFEMDKI